MDDFFKWLSQWQALLSGIVGFAVGLVMDRFVFIPRTLPLDYSISPDRISPRYDIYISNQHESTISLSSFVMITKSHDQEVPSKRWSKARSPKDYKLLYRGEGPIDDVVHIQDGHDYHLVFQFGDDSPEFSATGQAVEHSYNHLDDPNYHIILEFRANARRKLLCRKKNRYTYRIDIPLSGELEFENLRKPK